MGFYQNIAARERRRTAIPGKWKELLWADTQPKAISLALHKLFLADLPIYHADADSWVIGGDLCNTGLDGPEETPAVYKYADLSADLDRSPIPRANIFAIPGNHDGNYGGSTTSQLARSWDEYLKFFPRIFYHTIQGNVLRVFIGDMVFDGPGQITDVAFDWFKALVRRHQHYMIILYVHQPFRGTLGTDVDASDSDRIQRNSERFTSILGTPGCRVDLVVSGHNSFSGTNTGLTDPLTVAHEFKYGAWHVNVGLHTDSYVETGNDVSYCVMEFVHGSRYVRVRRWNASKRQYIPSKEFSVRAPAPIQITPTLTFDGRNQFDERSGVIDVEDKLTITRAVKRDVNTGGVWTVSEKPQVLLDLILQDTQGDDLPAGVGPAIAFQVPGAAGGDDAGIHAYGYGGAVWAARIGTGDANWAATLKLLASPAPGPGGQTIDTLTSVTTIPG
jgi:Predicted phosphohydrolases